MNNQKLKIAIDFDGTVVEHKFPEIGQEMPYAFEVLKELQERGHLLILWTVRDGIYLEDAVNFCFKNGVNFYAVNKSYPDEIIDNTMSRKINVDIFIDDRNVGGFLGWERIREFLIPDSKYIKKCEEKQDIKTNKNKDIKQKTNKKCYLNIIKKKLLQ